MPPATITAQIASATLTKPQRRLALWLLEECDDSGYNRQSPSQMTHVLLGKDGPPGRVYGDTRTLYAALEALCRANILGFTWTPLTNLGWAQDITTAFFAWPNAKEPNT